MKGIKTKKCPDEKVLKALTLVALGMPMRDVGILMCVKSETVRRWLIKGAPGTPAWNHIESSIIGFGLPETLDHFQRLFKKCEHGYQLRGNREVGRILRERVKTFWPPTYGPSELGRIVRSILGKKSRPFKFVGERFKLTLIKSSKHVK